MKRHSISGGVSSSTWRGGRQFPLSLALGFLLGVGLLAGCKKKEDKPAAQLIEETPTPGPSIAGFSPGWGGHGTWLHIWGEGFSIVESKNSVTLNGVPAGVISSTPSDILVVVPKNLSATGPVRVSVGGKMATSAASFTYVPTVVVSTVAGGPWGYRDGLGANTQFNSPGDVAADMAGNLYVADTDNHRIRKISPAGEVSTFAGDGKPGHLDGTGVHAQFYTPRGIAADTAGNIYVADTGNHLIRKISPTGEVSTFAGSTRGYLDDSIGTNARFAGPHGIATDTAGNVYVADSASDRIRKISPAGAVSTVAGSKRGFLDGPGTDAQFNSPQGVTVDKSGNLYVTELLGNRVRKILPTGEVSTLAGDVSAADGEDGSRDDTGTNARFCVPKGITVDAEGNLYVVEMSNNRIRKISPAGAVSTLAGSTLGFSDGMGANAQLKRPQGITLDKAGNLYVADTDNHHIRKVSPAGEVSTFVGSMHGSLDGTGANAQFSTPRGIVADKAGNLYVADTGNHRIRKISPAGEVSVFAGSTQGYLDGMGVSTRFNSPWSITADAEGNLYVADIGNSRIRKISPAGEVSTFAGDGKCGDKDSNIGREAQFCSPQDITADSAGNLYVADTNNHRIRKISPAGAVSTLAGSTQGYFDATGTNAQFSTPRGIAADTAGNIYVADFHNNRIRKISPAGEVSTFAGSTQGRFDSVGPNAKFYQPQGITADAAGNLYVADSYNHLIRKISPLGEVSTIAGDVTQGHVDGIGLNTRFNLPQGLAIDAAGNLHVADSSNHRIRKIAFE